MSTFISRNDPAALLRLSFSHLNLGVSSSVPFIDDQTSTALVQFKYFPINHQFPTTSIFSSSYIPDTMNSVSDIRQNFPGGELAFDQFVIKRLTVSPETVAFSPTQVWDHFGRVFVTPCTKRILR